MNYMQFKLIEICLPFFTVCIQALSLFLQLNKKVKVKPIQIPKEENDIPTGKTCVVMGWGTTDSKVMIPSDKLQMLEVSVMNRKRCNHFYSEYFEITTDMICAGSMETNRGTCWVCHILIYGKLFEEELPEKKKTVSLFFREIPVDH